MTCKGEPEQLIDVLYDEEISPAATEDFFRHVGECEKCRSDFLDLVQTRKLLSSWEIDPAAERSTRVWTRPRRLNWWSTLQKIAASILILVGALSILKGAGWWGDRVTVSERQLLELVNDVVVARQAEHERAISNVLQEMPEAIGLEQDMYYISLRLQDLEEKVREEAEERDRLVQVMAVQ